MKKLKYLTILLLPSGVSLTFILEGWFTLLTLFLFFIIVPIVEHFLPIDSSNLTETERLAAENDPFYDRLIYFMAPVQYGFLIWYLFVIKETTSTIEIIGRTQAMGLMCGVIGINVGHELGHRHSRFEKFLGDLLLLTSLENHFVPYHNQGHHTNVATPGDPATARKNEPLYFFWLRSHVGSYIQAWKFEVRRMKIMGRWKLGLYNKMVQYTLMQLLFCAILYVVFDWKGLFYFLIVAFLGVLLLETVNYIEHYGLLRRQRENGTYENVKRIHSWNSDHTLGRVLLFELSRHSDHHFKADKPYQLLESHDESPKMPSGYPAMMLLSLIPPLFFRKVNPLIEQLDEKRG